MRFPRWLTHGPAARLYSVEGNSMTPTFPAGNLLLVSGEPSTKEPPKRGDAVIIRDPTNNQGHSLKRVVGLPGEDVLIAEGSLFVDGEPLAEPYLGGLPASMGLDSRGWKLGEGDYFVMGDNRAHSTDSREFGPVGLDRFVGKVTLRLWPVGRRGG